MTGENICANEIQTFIKWYISVHFFLATGYIIEKRPLIGKGARWTKVVTLDATTHQYCIENLKESEFLFRVFAENSLGLSIPTNSEPITLKTHASKPINASYYCQIIACNNKQKTINNNIFF